VVLLGSELPKVRLRVKRAGSDESETVSDRMRLRVPNYEIVTEIMRLTGIVRDGSENVRLEKKTQTGKGKAKVRLEKEEFRLE
jgi:hypothetical protein